MTNQLGYLRAEGEIRGNSGQWAAYTSTGSCVILAGPGSGKTKTITIKIARLLAEDIKSPRSLACITYSNECVGELSGRLRKLGVNDSKQLLLSTVHSFCLAELVVPFGRLAGLKIPDPISVASPSDSRRFFRNACEKVLGSVQSSSFKTACDRIRRTVIDRASREWHSGGRYTAVIEAYENELLENGMMDFDGLVLAGLDLVERHAWVRDAIRAKFPIVVIDEYQDLGVPLHKIVVSLMTCAGVRIIAVGDPDQSIYGFTGARPYLLRELSELEGVERIELKLNYRCADRIITASKLLLADPPNFQSHDGHQGEIKIYRLECDVDRQARFAFTTIVPELLRKNPTWRNGDIAFLYRSLHEGGQIAEAADELGIKYFRRDNGAIVKRSRLIDLMVDMCKWCAGGWETGAASLIHILKNWRALRRSPTRESALVDERGRLVSFLFANRNGGMSLHQWLNEISQVVVCDMLDSEAGLADERDNFEQLVNATAENSVLSDFTVEIFGNHGKSPDQINLITLHSSKGLEFEAVIMVGLEDGEFPSRLAKTDDEQAESVRLFYVGITRAKREIHLIHAFNESPLITRIRHVAS